MKVSLNWLRELVELPPTVAELVDLLTLAGVEVEGVETRGVAIPNVVVAEIRDSVQHPNADRLRVCQVEAGSGAARQIVCGAKNYKVGDKVPLALPGAKLPGDFTIKVGKLRGVESQGMLCSAEELGLPKGEDGLLILSPDARVGAPIAELFEGDTILDLEITPNRPDLLSNVGIAREIATLTGKPIVPKPGPNEPPVVGEPPQVAVESLSPCYYTARRIAGVKVAACPDWMRKRLEAIGVRSINNIVDVTNFIMLASGQPLHAFDAAKLTGTLRVRQATAGEPFRALDGKTYTLEPADLVIADDARAVAIAGIMGGEESGVTSATTDVVLESAYFDPASIRRTSRRLGLSSDSSYRFERGVNVAAVDCAGAAAARYIADCAGTTGVSAPATASNDPTLLARINSTLPSIALRTARVRTLLGADVSEDRIAQILSGFGLVKSSEGWVPPSFRPDLSREVDLIEEIARVIGLDQIPARLQARFAASSKTDKAYDRQMNLRRVLAAQGLAEARSVTLVPAEPLGLAFTHTSPENLRRVRNPMIDDQVVLRPNLLHGLLRAVRHNLRAGAKSVRLFEIGRVYSAQKPEEFTHLGLVLSGTKAGRSWRTGEGSEADLFDLKGIVENLCGSGTQFTADANPALALSLVIQVHGKPVGFAGQLWPKEARELDASAAVLFAEIDLDALARAGQADAAKQYRDIPRFPAVTRDIALLAPTALAHAQIENTLRSAGETLLAEVSLFDLFTDPSGVRVPAGQKSLAYSLTYRSPERTLTADEVNAAHGRLKERLKSNLGVALRE
ncbi:MAG: phenylalanyl-tRNA synthetase, beta subunit [Chthoniobacter sp.]|nr:phenylalanyl-tRNA synthetase, beta subunit [Chthoniobacter sp.]